jgi:hypothetical protein
MPLIDDRGRLFGRFNIIDAALVAFVLVLLPIGFTAARLFRPRTPVIDRVEPAEQPVGPARRISLHGKDFRPYLRVFVTPTGKPYSLIERRADGREGAARIEAPEVIEVELPNLVAGSYDLYLYDETKEVARRTAAFALSPAAVPERTVEARIRFLVSTSLAKLIKTGDVDVSEPAPALPAGTVAPAATLKSVRVASPKAPAFEMKSASGGVAWLGWTGSDAKAIDADVVIPVRQNPRGIWEYGQQKIRVGDRFEFQTTRYSIVGVIDDVSAFPSRDSALPRQAGQ